MLRIKKNELYGFIVSSKLRFRIIETMYNNPTLRQTEIANILNQKQQNISKAVYDLISAKLIESLNPAKKAWKSYVISELGREVFEFAENAKKKSG